MRLFPVGQALLGGMLKLFLGRRLAGGREGRREGGRRGGGGGGGEGWGGGTFISEFLAQHPFPAQDCGSDRSIRLLFWLPV